MLDLQEDAVIL